MRWRHGLLIVILVIALPLAAEDKAGNGAAKKGESKPPVKEEKKSPVNKYHVVNRIAGRLTNLDAQEMLIEVEVRVPSSRSSGRNEKITFKIASDVAIRIPKLPERLDEKGKPIPYTPQEKAKHKGDAKLPGYAGDMNSLKNGQGLELELSTTKAPNPNGKKNPEEDEKPFVTRIVIAEEAPQKIEKKKK